MLADSVVTHDRWFLDEIRTDTRARTTASSSSFEGGYGASILQRERDRQAAAAEASGVRT